MSGTMTDEQALYILRAATRWAVEHGDHVTRRALEHIATRLASAKPAQVPEGWQLVPKVLPQSMLDGARKAHVDSEVVYDRNMTDSDWEKFGLRDNRIRHVWAALLECAPTPAGDEP